MPLYRIDTDRNGTVEVDADNVQHQGTNIYHFYREHPGAAALRAGVTPEGLNWDQPQPYYPPLLIAMYSGVNRIEIIEE